MKQVPVVEVTSLPIFLNIFIVTGNQMLITSYGNQHLVSCRDKNV
jgi:hypothetical protein